MTAEVCVEKLQERLLDFQLNLDQNIVAITTDGASTLIKVGRLREPYQQLCFAHGLQLAIIDALYKIESRPTTLNEADCNYSDDDFEDLDEDDGLIIYNGSEPVKYTEKFYLNLIITKVRKIVRSFRKTFHEKQRVAEIC
ncbi:PREDICTED: uncharacterized protein LOC108367302 [Rhagoletis zephyria]|uniref:uncharacterized protein LOC108367302 n=1 Tax=Rhagoletis zephyria TaxID=28612 RepID=UPI00081191BA|nr:PREDICTED: uncharacterized protein LOC108367302 [Rhagoletis zephyria]